jgi:hypothetical protein
MVIAALEIQNGVLCCDFARRRSNYIITIDSSEHFKLLAITILEKLELAFENQLINEQKLTTKLPPPPLSKMFIKT